MTYYWGHDLIYFRLWKKGPGICFRRDNGWWPKYLCRI